MKLPRGPADVIQTTGELSMMDAAPGDPIRYATELELCRAHRDAWLRMQEAIEANDTHAVEEWARRLEGILESLGAERQ